MKFFLKSSLIVICMTSKIYAGEGKIFVESDGPRQIIAIEGDAAKDIYDVLKQNTGITTLREVKNNNDINILCSHSSQVYQCYGSALTGDLYGVEAQNLFNTMQQTYSSWRYGESRSLDIGKLYCEARYLPFISPLHEYKCYTGLAADGEFNLLLPSMIGVIN